MLTEYSESYVSFKYKNVPEKKLNKIEERWIDCSNEVRSISERWTSICFS